eukprot:11187175-Lingulodinium_polyedra.AAC.1
MEQAEQFLVFVDKMTSLPDRPRIFHPGSNRGNVWTQIVMDPVDRLWHIPHAERMTSLGDAVRPAGGRCKETSNVI